MRTGRHNFDPGSLLPYVWGLAWFVLKWLGERILDTIGARVQRRHVIGGIAFGTGFPGLGIGSWALWIIFRYELPVAVGLLSKYPQGVLAYLGSQIIVWSVSVIVGALLIGLAIIAFFPNSPWSDWIARHMPLLKRNPFRRQRDRTYHFP